MDDDEPRNAAVDPAVVAGPESTEPPATAVGRPVRASSKLVHGSCGDRLAGVAAALCEAAPSSNRASSPGSACTAEVIAAVARPRPIETRRYNGEVWRFTIVELLGSTADVDVHTTFRRTAC